MSPLLAAAEVVITEKVGGENTTIFSEGCHPRSPDARYHPSRDWVKAFAAGISPMLAANERIVGEYLFARHSIGYDNLPSYFFRFRLDRRRRGSILG
ncbi:RNA ligase family protein [Phaeobacter sp. NW0010-22]|uniref:RNA ligase family protein n=1 Tax=Phaeobacter sp. NW0010-22 TaxID=3135907 RepID=UPI0033411071